MRLCWFFARGKRANEAGGVVDARKNSALIGVAINP